MLFPKSAQDWIATLVQNCFWTYVPRLVDNVGPRLAPDGSIGSQPHPRLDNDVGPTLMQVCADGNSSVVDSSVRIGPRLFQDAPIYLQIWPKVAPVKAQILTTKL